MRKSTITAYAAACAVLSTGILLGSSPAVAQSGDEQIVDLIVVTGSNLRRKKDYSSPSPVQTVGQAELENAASVKLQDVFKGLTANSGSQTSNRQNALQGVSQFSLRGLGIGSTLTLVNGRRAGLAPVTDATGQLFTDANQFPVNMIERIEVLTDGASATYGSEAVAGVVNIITRDDFEGFEITAEGRDSTHTSQQLGMAAGSKFDRGDFQVFVNYYQQDGNYRGDFDFIRARDAINKDAPTYDIGGVFSSGTGSPGKFNLAVPSEEGGMLEDGSERSGNTLADPDCHAAGGILEDSSTCEYNFINQRRLIAEEKRLQVFTQFDFQVNEDLNFFNEVSFSRNENRDALGGGVLRSTTPHDGGFLVPADHPFNFFVSNGDGGIRYDREAFEANPNLDAVPVIFRGRPLGSAFDGDNAAEIVTTFENLRFMGGFDYELNENWILTGSWQWADNSYTRQQPRDYDSSDFQEAITNHIWNPFGTAIVEPDLVTPRDGDYGAGNTPVAGNTPEDLSEFSYTINRVGRVTQNVFEFVLSGETDWQLDGGNVAVAVGFQDRKLTFEETPDGRRQSGTNGRAEIEPAIPETSQDAMAFFGEAALPISDRLEAAIALRFEDYGDEGGDTSDPKFSAKYDLNDQYSVRGSYGTSFQAPSIRQVAGAIGNDGVNDPNNPNGGSFNVTVFTTGSSDLESQKAENINLGFIGTLDNGLDFSVDYFTYEYEDLILPDGSAQSIVNAYSNDPTRVQRDPSGQLNAVFTRFENRGDASIAGVDLQAAYDAGQFYNGDLTFNAAVTLITEFESTEFDGLDGEGDLKGSRNNGNAFGSTPDTKVNLGGTWVRDNHTANVSLRHIGEYEDDQSGEAIDSQMTIDARYTISLETFLGGATDLSIGAVNLLDEDTPEIEARPLFDTEVHDPRGRQIYVSIKQTF